MHPRRRKIAVVLLAAGTLIGFGHGFATMRGRACARRAAFEEHVASVCVDAARREREADAPPGEGRSQAEDFRSHSHR